MSNVSPQSQAADARVGLIQSIKDCDTFLNKRMAFVYAEAVRQWVSNKEQGGKPYPIPVPPASWVTVPHTYTEQEKMYDASYPGIPALVDDAQVGPPVAQQYVEPGTAPTPPAGSILHIGPYMRDGEWACMPDDNMPVGFITRTSDGTWVKKIELPTPWGVARAYSSKVG